MSLSLEIGTKIDDTLPGTDDTDILLGLKGDDVLDGGGGNDLLLGGKGDDTLDGGSGDDFLVGGNGEDTVYGGDGNDRLRAGNGDDRLDGGSGDDFLDGGNGDDALDGGAGNDRLLAGKGDDTLNYTLSENIGDTDYYDGGKGFDTLQLTLTSAEMLLVQDEIDAFRAFLDGGGKVFHFESFGLTVRGIEDLVIVEIGGGNAAPVAVDDALDAVEDTALLIPVADLLANDSDAEGSALTVTVVSGPSSGTLELGSDGSSYTYTPDLNFHGEDIFTYQVSDGELSSEIATVTIQVAPVNDAPTAADDAFAGDEDTVITGDVLDNDADVDGDELSTTLLTGPQNGTLVLAADGSFTYTPNADFNGEDSFTYQASDAALDDAATVMIQVAPVNDDPVAEDDVVPNTIAAAIRVAVVGGVKSTYVDAAGQLSDSTAFDIAADPFLVTAFATQAEWAAELSEYDVVVLGDSGPGTDYQVDNGLFAALRGFLDGGGGVVTTGWFAKALSFNESQFSQLADADYVSPVAAAFGESNFTRLNDTEAVITINDPSHPIAGGEPSYTVETIQHELAFAHDTSATILATGTATSAGSGGSTSLPAIAYDEVMQGLTVYLGALYLASDGTGGTQTYHPELLRDGVHDAIFEQAVAWAAGDLDPVAATDGDTPLVIDDEFLFANDSDIDSDADMFTIAEVVAFSARDAAVSVDPVTGDILYDPTVSAELQALEAGQIVEDSFQYIVADGNGGFSDPATVTLSILGRAEADALIA